MATPPQAPATAAHGGVPAREAGPAEDGVVSAAEAVPAADRAAPGPDAWRALRRFTAARIALGRAGTSLPTTPHLDFQAAHAQARDAVHQALDVPALLAALGARGLDPVALRSAAGERRNYLQRPDLGRRLDAESRARLRAHPGAGTVSADLALVLADGLSARAVERHALPLIDQLLPRIAARGWRLAPLAVVEQGRVAVGDEIGEILAARLLAILIGERPGLSSPDSLGVYLTWQPRVGTPDSARNCLSNIRLEGLAYALAAHKLDYLMGEATRRALTGVGLKDGSEAPASLPRPVGDNFMLVPD